MIEYAANRLKVHLTFDSVLIENRPVAKALFPAMTVIRQSQPLLRRGRRKQIGPIDAVRGLFRVDVRGNPTPAAHLANEPGGV